MENNYTTGFYFKLSFKGEEADFQEVSGISEETNVEEVEGGGENRFKYRLPTTNTASNLVLKRALIPKDSVLGKWCSDTLDSDLSHPIKTQDITVQLINAEGNVSASWVFFNAYPVKWNISDLKSQNSEILIESIELAYSHHQQQRT